MGWFSTLLMGAPWTPERVERYEVDAEALIVCGLGIGDHNALVEPRLGPPDRFLDRRRGTYFYHALGLVFFSDEAGLLRSLSVYGSGCHGEFGLFAGRWLPARLCEGVREPDEEAFVELFGEPTRRYEDDGTDGPTLEWSRGNMTVSVDLDREGLLAEFSVDK
jgi:hypothetical protein